MKCACGTSTTRRLLGCLNSEYHSKKECHVQHWATITKENKGEKNGQ